MALSLTALGTKPEWLTFDCYGTLIQWDEGLLAAVNSILGSHAALSTDAASFIRTFDAHEHELESSRPHLSFRDVARGALTRTMSDLGLPFNPGDVETLTARISKMPPFPEVVEALSQLKMQGFKLCIVSNTDDDIISGNVAQLGGHIDRVVTAQQARAYKPSHQIFAYAHAALSVAKASIIHICASPHLDLVAARDIGFRCFWIDRGTGRKVPPDYTPDAIFPTLDRVPALFDELGWGKVTPAPIKKDTGPPQHERQRR